MGPESYGRAVEGKALPEASATKNSSVDNIPATEKKRRRSRTQAVTGRMLMDYEDSRPGVVRGEAEGLNEREELVGGGEAVAEGTTPTAIEGAVVGIAPATAEGSAPTVAEGATAEGEKKEAEEKAAAENSENSEDAEDVPSAENIGADRARDALIQIATTGQLHMKMMSAQERMGAYARRRGEASQEYRDASREYSNARGALESHLKRMKGSPIPRMRALAYDIEHQVLRTVEYRAAINSKDRRRIDAIRRKMDKNREERRKITGTEVGDNILDDESRRALGELSRGILSEAELKTLSEDPTRGLITLFNRIDQDDTGEGLGQIISNLDGLRSGNANLAADIKTFQKILEGNYSSLRSKKSRLVEKAKKVIDWGLMGVAGIAVLLVSTAYAAKDAEARQRRG